MVGKYVIQDKNIRPVMPTHIWVMTLTDICTFTCAEHAYIGFCFRPGPSNVIFLPPKTVTHVLKIDNFDLIYMGDCLWSQKNDLGWARTEAKPYIGMFSTWKGTNISHCHHSYVWAYIFVSDVMLSDHSVQWGGGRRTFPRNRISSIRERRRKSEKRGKREERIYRYTMIDFA